MAQRLLHQPLNLSLQQGACSCPHAACLPQVLLELGADINAPNPGNNTRPVQSAALGGPAEALAFLADRGANLAVKGGLCLAWPVHGGLGLLLHALVLACAFFRPRAIL